jgi:hypothetical protein
MKVSIVAEALKRKASAISVIKKCLPVSGKTSLTARCYRPKGSVDATADRRSGTDFRKL